MRRGELLNTTWRDVDFAAATVEVCPKKDTKETWEWHVKDSLGCFTQGQFCCALVARPLGRRKCKKAVKRKCLTAFNLLIEAEGTRTLNLRIDSPNRGFVSICE